MTSTRCAGSPGFVRRRLPDARNDPAQARGHLPSFRPHDQGAARHDPLQRGPLDRAPDRFDVRRSRHVRQVQSPRHPWWRGRRNRRSPAAATGRDRRRMAAFLPGPHLPGHDVRGAAASSRAEGRDDGPRPAGHPRPECAQGVPGAPRADDGRSAQRRGTPEGRAHGGRTRYGRGRLGASHDAPGFSRSRLSRHRGARGRAPGRDRIW